MLFNFKLELRDKEIIDGLKKLEKRVKNTKKAMQAIGAIVETSVKQNFLVGGRYSQKGSIRGGSRTWQPLAVSTLLAGPRSKIVTKRGRFRVGFVRKIKNRRILISRGQGGTSLMRSISFDASRNSVRIGPDPLPYAAIHQFGGRAGRGRKVHIPARPYLVIQREDQIEILASIKRHIERG